MDLNSMINKFGRWFLDEKLYTLPDTFFIVLLFIVDDTVFRLLIIIFGMFFKFYLKKKMLSKIEELENG